MGTGDTVWLYGVVNISVTSDIEGICCGKTGMVTKLDDMVAR